MKCIEHRAFCIEHLDLGTRIPTCRTRLPLRRAADRWTSVTHSWPVIIGRWFPARRDSLTPPRIRVSVQELYPVREGAVVHRPRCFHEGGGGPRISRVKTDTGGNFQRTTGPVAPGNNERWEICFVGAAGICDAELDWSVDLADGAGNGSVRKPRIRAMKSLQNLSQTLHSMMRRLMMRHYRILAR